MIKMDKAIIIAVNTNNPIEKFNEELTELKNLCEACEIEIVDQIIQNLDKINPSTYLGKGKVDEIKRELISLDISLVVTADELTPLQLANLEKLLDVEVYDRTFVILEIFRRRAKTKEAILQVEMATQKYLLPRLVGRHQGFSRQRGTGGGFARGRGAGEMKLELERRGIYDQMSLIKKELDELTHLRKQQRIKRKKNQMKVVSLVGYTNSGKSSTLNGLLQYSVAIKKEVFEKDMLFATLETSTRMIKTANNLQFLLTDTVGFVSKLPHQLIEAFKSTLEEITESDLIIHVVDAANLHYEEQIATTNQVLSEIGVKDIPMIYVFNKIDLLEDYFYIPAQYENAIRISATNNQNLDKLLTMIEDELFKSYRNVTLVIPYTNSSIVSTIKDSAIINKFEQLEEHYLIEAKVSDYLYEYVKEFIK